MRCAFSKGECAAAPCCGAAGNRALANVSRQMQPAIESRRARPAWRMEAGIGGTRHSKYKFQQKPHQRNEPRSQTDVVSNREPRLLVFGPHPRCDRLTNVLKCLFFIASLRNTSGQSRTFHYDPAIFRLFERHVKQHQTLLVLALCQAILPSAQPPPPRS